MGCLVYIRCVYYANLSLFEACLYDYVEYNSRPTGALNAVLILYKSAFSASLSGRFSENFSLLFRLIRDFLLPHFTLFAALFSVRLFAFINIDPFAGIVIINV